MRCRIAEDEAAGLRAGEAPRDARGARARRGGARASSSRGSRTCSASASTRSHDRQDLFAAWRLFFERLADVYPTVLAFEDMQWADACLLDFVEYLLEWSRNSPDVRGHARAAGAARAAADLGRRPSELHLALPRAALRRRRWRSCSTGLVPGLPDDGARADPRPRGGRAAVRGRDRADAARPRRCSSRRAPSYRPVGDDRGARGAGDAARADRGPARRPHGGGAAPAPGRRGARQDVHARRRSPRSPGSRDGARPAARVARAQGGARRCSPTRARPSTASTASSRTSSATSPTRRSRKRERRARHLAAAEHLAAALSTRTRWPRWSHRTRRRPTRPNPTPTTRPRSSERARARARGRGRAGGVARRGGGGQALLRAGGGAGRRAAAEGRFARPGGRDGRRQRRPRRGAHAPAESRSSSTRPRATRTPPPRASGRLGRARHGAPGRGDRAARTGLRGHRRRRARRGPRHARRAALSRAIGSAATWSGRRAGGARARHRRGAAAAGGAGVRAPGQGGRRVQPRTRAGSGRAHRSRRSTSRSSTTSARRVDPLLHPLRRLLPPTTLCGGARRTSTKRSPCPGRSAAARPSGLPSPSGPIR